VRSATFRDDPDASGFRPSVFPHAKVEKRKTVWKNVESERRTSPIAIIRCCG